jgi:protein ImuB
MESGPERIETGWWDGKDAARDYYTVLTASGERLWVYRQRGGRRDWYLHGIFG